METLPMTFTLPHDFDPDLYLLMNPDVAAAGEDPAKHYEAFGVNEGRIFRIDVSRRQGIAITASRSIPALEIGPFCNPVLKGEGVFYFDVLDRENLIARAKYLDQPINFAPHIHYVSPDADLSIVDRVFAAVLSSHCIEHQPDLIGHLQKVARILEPGGGYYLIIPDKRYCFDSVFEESSIAEVLAAHIEKRKLHTLKSYFEHHVLITHNDPALHWAGVHKVEGYDDTIALRARHALENWPSVEGSYFDVHAWQFTPNNFATLIGHLKKLQLIDFEIETIGETPRNQFEFTAVLRKT